MVLNQVFSLGVVTSALCFKTLTSRAAGSLSREKTETLSTCLLLPYRCVLVSCFPPTLLSSNHPHSLFRACSRSFPSLLIAVRWCHLDMKMRTPCNAPAVPSAGRPKGRVQISTGMDSQRSIYLYLIIRQLQEKESCTSTSPSRCLISQSFSYWIFLFKGALLRPTTSSAAGGDWRRKQWVVSFSNPRMCQVDYITSYLDPSEAFFLWTSFCDSQHQLERDLHVFMFYLGSVWEKRCRTLTSLIQKPRWI